ncbi:MAG: GNAT family N-acetyltransferase [Cyanobacteria bacterium P01_H01_bin.21]
MQPQHIRAALPQDSQLLTALALRSKAYWGYSQEFMVACRQELSQSREKISTPKFHFFVCEIAETITGFYALEQLSPTKFELEALFVEPDWMGQGIGRLLMEHAKAKALCLGGQLLYIYADPNAAGFYQAMGGILTGTQESASVPGRFLPIYILKL